MTKTVEVIKKCCCGKFNELATKAVEDIKSRAGKSGQFLNWIEVLPKTQLENLDKIEAMVKAIIGDFKSGKKDKVQVYSNKNGTKMCVTYLPMRDDRGEYLGTVELCQDMAFFEGDKR